MHFNHLLQEDTAGRYCLQYENKNFDYLTSTFTKKQIEVFLLKEIKFYLDYIKDIKYYDKEMLVENLFREKINSFKKLLILIK